MAGLYITGLAGKYPPYLNGPEKLEEFAKKFYDVETLAFQKLFAINRTSGIETRSSIRPFDDDDDEEEEGDPVLLSGPRPPSIADIDRSFRLGGVDLAAQACAAAMREAGVRPAEITHSVAVTSTSAGGNPGFDVPVLRELGVPSDVDRVLLGGAGCAGGLAALRTAANVAGGRRRAARVLVFACEVCSANARRELEEVAAAGGGGGGGGGGGLRNMVAPVLFSDGAAALVLCNELAVAGDKEEKAVFSLLDWGHLTLPGTYEDMTFLPDPLGFKTVISKDVPRLTSQAIRPMFDKLKPQFPPNQGEEEWKPEDFDWALHPGGKAILEAAQARLGITEDHLRASFDIYRTRGNSSSPTVLIVLDRLRKMGSGRDDVVACSFGPGLAIEMVILKRCR